MFSFVKLTHVTKENKSLFTYLQHQFCWHLSSSFWMKKKYENSEKRKKCLKMTQKERLSTYTTLREVERKVRAPLIYTTISKFYRPL